MSHFNGISGGKVKRAVTEHEWWMIQSKAYLFVIESSMNAMHDDVSVGGTFTYVHTRQVILQHALLFLQKILRGILTPGHGAPHWLLRHW